MLLLSLLLLFVHAAFRWLPAEDASTRHLFGQRSLLFWDRSGGHRTALCPERLRGRLKTGLSGSCNFFHRDRTYPLWFLYRLLQVVRSRRRAYQRVDFSIWPALGPAAIGNQNVG